HVLVRSLRIEAALRNEIPIEQLRPLPCLHVARAFARDIVDALASCSRTASADLLVHRTPTLLAIARAPKPSRSPTSTSLILGAALRNEIPIEQLRPLACLHVARAFARDIVDALASCSRTACADLLVHMTPTLLAIAREQKPSRSRTRISLILGAVGA